ncbi:MAG: citrate synthase/methylcitrate synthase, partial [Sphingomonadales bacterium]
MDAGLEKIVAAETVLSDVQGAEGRLIIRGMDVKTLAREFTFGQAAGHMWAGFFDTMPELQAALGKARVEAFERMRQDFARPAPLPEVDALRA